MRRFIKFALLAVSMMATSPAFAAAYCWTVGPPVCMGCTQYGKMEVVVSTYPRPKAPSQYASTWCGAGYRSLSAFYAPISVIDRPKLGEVRVKKWAFIYSSAKVGKDSFTIQTHQLNGQNGQQTSATVHFDVDVVAQPF